MIAPGLIFGFDSDTADVFRDTLAFVVETGLIGGDPSFLYALPGTPLFERMKRTGRLVLRREHSARHKIATNIRYLQEPSFLARGFMQFMRDLNSAPIQLARFRRHLQSLSSSADFVPSGSGGAGSGWKYLRLQLSTPADRGMLLARLWFLAKPANALAVVRGFWAWQRAERARPGLVIHYFFWLYFWTNLGLKYRSMREADLDLHGAGAGIDAQSIARDASLALLRADQLVKGSKAARQARHTSAALGLLANGADPPESEVRRTGTGS